MSLRFRSITCHTCVTALQLPWNLFVIQQKCSRPPLARPAGRKFMRAGWSWKVPSFVHLGLLKITLSNYIHAILLVATSDSMRTTTASMPTKTRPVLNGEKIPCAEKRAICMEIQPGKDVFLRRYRPAP